MRQFGLIFLLGTIYAVHSTKFNRTYMLFVSEDVSIGHRQIIDTFERSFCSMYTRKPSLADSPFEISLITNGSCTLNLDVIHLLDREQKSMYIFEEELVHENLSMIIQLSILILDVNDHIPQFETEHFHFQVKENLSPGTFIGRVEASDPDIFLNGKIHYTLSGDDLLHSDNRTIFRIDKDTGEIFLGDSTLDYERKKEYRMMIEAKDYGNIETNLWPSVSSYADVTIQVEDVNDEKPEIILTIPEGDSLRRMKISNPQLSKEQNRLIDSFHSSIKPIENDAELILLTKEEPLPVNTLLALLHLRDQDEVSNGLLSLDLQIYVQCSTEQILQNNRTFCQECTLFHLSIFRPNVYGLSNTRILDREEYENYLIHLIAHDNGTATSELFIYLILLDINDNNPIFNQTYFHIKIDENQSKRNILTRVHAHDLDQGPNGTVHYELLIKQNPVFTLDKYSGILRANEELDREKCELYRIGIRAYDLGSPEPKYSSIILVDVEINNLNDNIPYFLHESYHFQVMENTPIGQLIGRVTIGDRDEQEPIEQMIDWSTMEEEDFETFNPMISKRISKINYSMIDFLFVDSQENQSLSGLFTIDSQGFIHTLAIFDRELQSNYSVFVSIYDPILNSYAHPTQLIIEILDENDNLPYESILFNTSIFSIEQIDNTETIICEFQPIDHDIGLNGLVSIECLNCSSIFYLQNSSRLTTRSNRTIPNGIYTLAFLMRDHGLIISHQHLYTLTFNLTYQENSRQWKRFFLHGKEHFIKYFRYYFPTIWFLFLLIILSTSYRYYQVSIEQTRDLPEVRSDLIEYTDEHFHPNNFNSITIENHSRPLSEFHHISSPHPSLMNSRETILTNAATNTSHEQIWQPMSKYNENKEVLYENTKPYQFQPIEQDSISSQSNISHSIQRPIPVPIERAKKPYTFQTKRNSTMNIDSSVRSYGLPRSLTSDHLANNSSNRLYYYPSVQDVLDALNRRSFDKESFV